MYRASCGVHLQFAHHVRGHRGPCISLHGHTWRFEIAAEARELDAEGFVIDFDRIQDELFIPVFNLLDHSLALGEKSYSEVREDLARMGETLVSSRRETIGGLGNPPPVHAGSLAGARNERPGGIKVAVFPFTPTSERLAQWLHGAAQSAFGDDRVRIARARIYESLQPSESFADYEP